MHLSHMQCAYSVLTRCQASWSGVASLQVLNLKFSVSLFTDKVPVPDWNLQNPPWVKWLALSASMQIVGCSNPTMHHFRVAKEFFLEHEWTRLNRVGTCVNMWSHVLNMISHVFSCSMLVQVTRQVCSEHDGTCLNISKHEIYVQNMKFVFWTWSACTEHEIHVQNTKFMFKTWLSCSKHDKNMTAMSRTWQSCSILWLSCSEHDGHVLNMMVMFWTWMSCSEHDCHVLNMIVMFNNMTVMFWTWWSCSEHDCRVLNMTVMFWTWMSCSEHDCHVWACFIMFWYMKSCTRTWNSCSGCSCSGVPQLYLNMH